MADTNLLVLAREYKKLREEVKKVLSMPKGDKGDRGEKGEKGDKGDTGPQGFPGRDGKDGINGFNGKDGRDGIDGKDGKDGLDGVGVQNAYIDFDNSLVIVLSDGREVNAGFLSQETKENVVATFKQGAATINELLPSQEGNANKFLKTDGTNVSWDTLDGSDIDLASPPVIGNTTPNAATFTTLSTGALTATGQTSLGGAAGNESVRVTVRASATDYVNLSGGSSATGGGYIGMQGAGNANSLYISSNSSGSVRFYTNSWQQEQFRVSHTASAVNYVQVTGGATANFPAITAQGSDTNVGLRLSSKGTQSIRFDNNNTGNQLFRIDGSASASVNYFQVSGANTTFEPVFSAQGSDTNISMAFQSKGTGGISLSTGSTGTNLVNGTSVTAITRTNSGSGYTSLPSVAIGAPTTAGGVQATASVNNVFPSVATVASGGSGYTVGDTLTIVGGTGSAATYTVASVSAGAVTAVNVASGNYSVPPTNPVSVTGGAGTGCTLNLTYTINTIAVTNAGSGYVEQPTVTFSGGGGSGAAAYATVGSGATVRSLGSGMQFSTPGGLQVNVADSGATAANYWQMQGRAAGGGVLLSAQGSDSNVASFISSKGSGNVTIATNNFAQIQFNVAHTASAVNYVQVTGGATGAPGICTMSTQGSDANVSLIFQNKGTAAFSWFNGGGTSSRLFRVDGPATNMANHLQVNAAAAGSAPSLAVGPLSSDTNVDLALTPKGTGLVRFGTYTANMALTVQGYIEIKDSGGTTRRLAVIG